MEKINKVIKGEKKIYLYEKMVKKTVYVQGHTKIYFRSYA